MLHLYQQTLAAFPPDTGWGCYSPRPPGTKSEHPPLGRACDITFGNRIGQRPTPPAQLDAGWKVTNWMKDNADVLGVEYLIWQGQIWSVARDAEAGGHTTAEACTTPPPPSPAATTTTSTSPSRQGDLQWVSSPTSTDSAASATSAPWSARS